MNPTDRHVRLLQLLQQALEEMAFVLTDERDTPPASFDGWLEATLRFAGPPDGSLLIYAAPDVARELAENLLAVDDVEPQLVDDAAIHDALGELANVAAGVLLDEIFGADGSYALKNVSVCDASLEARARAKSDASWSASLVSDTGGELDIAFVVTP